jgi:riboflavin synthase
MFSGIVEEIGMVREAGRDRMTLEACVVLEGTKLGDSVAVNGICLTVVSLAEDSFTVDIMAETSRRTNLGMLRYNDQVNLERALPLGGRLGGHLVLGHIDDTGWVADVGRDESARVVRISAPPAVMRYIVSKGFVAVDGVSLTIADLDDHSFVVSLVGYTAEHTTLGRRMPGEVVNLEADIIGKYVERLDGRQPRALDLEFLREYGFAGRKDGG